MKISSLFDKWWVFPVGIAAEVVFIFGALYVAERLVPADALSRPQQKTLTNSFTVKSAGGDIEVIDLKSGTEFNRILIFPDGHAVVESGWVNHWGEEQIRIIDRGAAN
jgi:hypothetical protein